jgi:L-ascorbate metabolism protein UlaG (beta-lactamase superfamily)
MSVPRFTYIGGPSALIELAGFRFLTDPTFDPGGTDYPTPVYTLHKTQSPAVDARSLGHIDVVLLSHDHHFDNLDHAGRMALASAGAVFTTQAGAERLGGEVVGFAPWEWNVLQSPDGHELTVTATPARHGPANGDRGPVVGFVLQSSSAADPVVYVSGDTVWYDGVAEVGKRFDVDVAVLNLGAARVDVAGPYDLTFSADDAVTLARAWPRTTIVPLHYEGWTHFTEGRAEVSAAFAAAGLSDRIRWPIAGQAMPLN